MKNLPLTDLATARSLVSERRGRIFLLVLGAVILAFSLPLMDLLKFSLANDLFSHIVLVPFVSLYLIWVQRRTTPVIWTSTPWIAILAFGLGAIALAYYFRSSSSPGALPLQDRLALQMSALVLFVVGTVAAFVSRSTLRALAFPLGFLVFMVPFPVALVHAIESFFQTTSAAAAAAFFKLGGMSFFRSGTFFQLPGINLEVAPECSGIRSSLALFITSLVAGKLFLRSPLKRIILACFVVPLGILRNGLRIFVIGELCVQISPDMINSYIHHKGGPIFFALSLVPFSIFLYLLVRSESKKKPAAAVSLTPAPLPANNV